VVKLPDKRIGLYGGPGNGRQIILGWHDWVVLIPFVRPVQFFKEWDSVQFLNPISESVVTYAPADWDCSLWWKPVENKAYQEWRKMEEEKRSR
jgi:hypothetical protein